MEIQDKANILQQFLNAKMSGSFMSQTSDCGFAGMLKARKSEDVSMDVFGGDGNKTASLMVEKYSSVEADIIGKKDRKNDVKAVKNEASDKSSKKIKDKKNIGVSEEKSVAAAQVSSDGAQNKTINKDENVVEDGVSILSEKKSAEDGAVEGNILENLVAVAVDTADVLLPENTVIMAETVMPQVENDISQKTESPIDNLLQPVVADVETSDVSISEGEKIEKPADIVEASMIMEPDEVLLMRQAEYLDKKVNFSGKMKLNVSVQEEKIAAPVGDRVLQNSFEVDSLVRNFDIGNASVKTEMTSASSNNEADTPLNSQPAVETSFSITDNNPQLTMVAVQTADEVSQISLEASKLSVSGKEMVVEASSDMRSQTFSRINESSSRDEFRGLGKEAVEQIKVNITKSAVKGVDTIDIQLKPEDLGKIQIKMHITKDGRVQAEIISGRQETLDMLQKEVSDLSKAFENAGYETDGQSFKFSFQDDSQAGKQTNEDSELLKFIGDKLEQEAENVAGNDNIVYNPALGLNIRV